ncbi:C-reactive protein-like [Conger conger]|uniref:C-reactive protein-like n=1 Tax=Conger conger TaxID=82655 RepID=UPI002A5A40C9|nr:C-reactive protein-like [Conger conger]
MCSLYHGFVNKSKQYISRNDGLNIFSCIFNRLVSTSGAGLFGKALVFPTETDNSYVTLTPQKPLELKAFTVCMNVATELKGEREVILFAYRTSGFDELNIWREKDGRYSFYLSGDGVLFEIAQLNTFKTQLCATWESATGLSAFWVDGKRSVRKVYKQGHTIRPEGNVLLGQDPDSFLGDFDAKQSFVGEISDVNMWDYILSEGQIKALYSCSGHVPKGNILDWETTPYQIHGRVFVASAD